MQSIAAVGPGREGIRKFQYNHLRKFPISSSNCTGDACVAYIYDGWLKSMVSLFGCLAVWNQNIFWIGYNWM